jgi:hypothetical protein
MNFRLQSTNEVEKLVKTFAVVALWIIKNRTKDRHCSAGDSSGLLPVTKCCRSADVTSWLHLVVATGLRVTEGALVVVCAIYHHQLFLILHLCAVAPVT